MLNENVAFFGHAAYTIIFCSFLVRRMLWLRGLAILAGVFSIYYNFHIAKDPIWIPIQWNAVFIITNIIQITLLLMNYRKIPFKGKEKFLYEKTFRLFTPPEFKKLIKKGHFKTSHANETLINKNEITDGLFVLVKGEVSINIDETTIATLGPGQFIGEMSFLTNEIPKADVVTRCQVEYLMWSKEELNSFLESKPTIMTRFQATIGKQLVNTIANKNIEKLRLNEEVA